MTTKICTKCGEEKDLSEFHKNKYTKDGLVSKCKRCRIIDGRNYRNNHKEELKILLARWYQNNKERVKKTSEEWYQNNKERKRKIGKEWISDNPEKNLEIRKRVINKRKRNFGYIPLNEKFPGSVGHHISMDLVIYIPEELHKSIPHRYDDPISMGEINILALEYLPEGELNV